MRLENNGQIMTRFGRTKIFSDLYGTTEIQLRQILAP